MSDTTTPQAQSAAPAQSVFQVGQTVQFTAYAVPPAEGQDVFKNGDILKLEKPGTDPQTESYEATRVTDGASSTVFFDEIASYTPSPETAPVPEGEKKKKGGKKLTEEEKAAKEAEKAAAKAKKDAEAAAKKAAEEAPPAPLVLTEAVKALVSDDAVKVIEAAEVLSKQIDTNEFTLGGILAVVRREKHFTKLVDGEGKALFADDKSGFEAYVGARLSCGYRKAMYLIQMYEKYSALGVTEEQIAKIGWSKAVLMLNVVTAENKEQMLEFAETHTKSEVEAHVKSTRVNAGTQGNTSPRGVRHSFAFNLYNNDGESAKAIIEAAKADLPPEVKKDDKAATNAAFLKIVTEWSQLRAATVTPATPAAPVEAAAPAEAAPAA
jgi:hypothetical protein